MTKPDFKQKALDRQASIQKVNPQETIIIGQSPETGKIERSACGSNQIPLDSLVECRANINSLELADIIDVPALQSLMVDFYELTHVPMAIIDLNGKVLVGVGWQQICTEFHRVNHITCRYCIESDLELTSGIDESEFKLYKCKNNMWDAAVPLVIGGKKMGNLFTGQFFFDDETPDYELFRAQAKKYGFDETAYIAAVQKVTRLSRSHFKCGMSFLHGLAKMISQTSYINILLARLLEEQKSSQQALSQSRDDFSRAQAVGSMGSWRLNVLKNELTWSDESYNIFGMPKGTPLTYEIFLSCVHPDDRGSVDKKWQAALAGDDYDIEHRIVVNGLLKWVREKAYLEFNAKGELVGGFGITQDITYRKHIEENLRQLNESLEQRVTQRTLEVQNQADRLRALASQLSQTEQRERKRLSKILHDHIQQLLVAAKMQLGWLKNDHDPHRRQTIVQGVDAIIRETLEASRSLSVDLSPPILQEAGLIGGLSWLASRMRDKNGFTIHLSADNAAEPATEEVRFLLFECARELLLNALKHSGASEAQVTLKRLDDNNIQLTVCDDGKGFDPDKLNNRRLDEITFGLFSIRERLAHIGGQMQIQTACGRGARFTLTVAAGSTEETISGQSSPDQDGQNVSPRSDSQLPMCRVLVCDDHKIVREGLVTLLQFQPGIEVVGQAEDGEQAIEMAGNLSPDIIIMDVNLGRISGIAATERILAANSSIKVIGLSMHEDHDVAKAMRSAGAIAYLTKTGPSENLIAAVKACIKQEPTA